ncbi:uncharacterized protein SCHCODRAFT_02661574 [Schizophyllum commune H4-8]|nr:uncharacterized protein SCHCODRAFT_02661574 [Schizophyllum commune H4-8]KAI5900008.1 hypothetical protein SCHCODRAFT_02661574 [Schizophyllum commune H4-8]
MHALNTRRCLEWCKDAMLLHEFHRVPVDARLPPPPPPPLPPSLPYFFPPTSHSSSPSRHIPPTWPWARSD